MGSAANKQENDRGVNVLRRKDETKNKKKITEPETETRPASSLVTFNKSR